MELQTISQVAKNYGISVRTLRYYEQIGLIESIRKDDNAYRFYDETTVKQLYFIIFLRKLRISVKQIKEMLNNRNVLTTIEIFERNISELDEEITTLSTIKSILTRFSEELRSKSGMVLELDLLNDTNMHSIVDSISFSKNYVDNVKENYTMEDLNKAAEKIALKYPKLTNVKLVYLPPATIAVTKLFAVNAEGEDASESNGYDILAKFAEDTNLLNIKPDARTFGYNINENGKDGYEGWATIPDDLVLPNGFEKQKFPGGLYACHSRSFNDLDGTENAVLFDWLDNTEEFTYDKQRGFVGCYKKLEEIFVSPAYKFKKPETGGMLGIDFFIPIKETEEPTEEEKQEKINTMLALDKLTSHGKPIEIDLTTMKKIIKKKKKGNLEVRYENGLMVMRKEGWNMDGEFMATKEVFNVPVKIDLRARTDKGSITLKYAEYFVCIKWMSSNKVLICNDAYGEFTGHEDIGKIPLDEFVDIELIVGKDIMALKINGELRHSGTEYGYIKAFEENPEFCLSGAVCISTEDASTVTVEYLRVTEL